MEVAVIGAGTMGNGIAQVFAMHGHPVRMIDVSVTALDQGLAAVKGSLARVVKKAGPSLTTMGVLRIVRVLLVER